MQTLGQPKFVPVEQVLESRIQTKRHHAQGSSRGQRYHNIQLDIPVHIHLSNAVPKWLVGAHAIINFDNICFTYKVEIQCIIKRP